MGRMNVALWVVDGLIIVLFIFIDGGFGELDQILCEFPAWDFNSQINPTINKS